MGNEVDSRRSEGLLGRPGKLKKKPWKVLQQADPFPYILSTRIPRLMRAFTLPMRFRLRMGGKVSLHIYTYTSAKANKKDHEEPMIHPA